MRLATRVSTADPLAGRLPDELAPPALPSEPGSSRRAAGGAAAPGRRGGACRAVRPTAVLVVAACLVAVVLAVALPGSRASFAETFAVSSVSGGRAPAGLVDASAAVLRQRLSALDAHGWSVETGGASIRVSCAGCAAGPSSALARHVAQPGNLVVYDWRPDVLRAGCRPWRTAAGMSGATAGGRPGDGTTTYYRAVLRASRCPTRHYDVRSRAVPDYYALDPTQHRVLGGPQPSAAAARVAAGARARDARIVAVPVGTTVLMAEYDGDGPAEPDDAAWYVVRDRPALTGRDVTDARVHMVGGRPRVELRLTPEGQRKLRTLTRRIAERARRQARPGVPPAAAAQHFAIALDHRLLVTPFVDFESNPHGIDARDGLDIAGGFTPESARALVALLRSGALPARLTPAPARQ